MNINQARIREQATSEMNQLMPYQELAHMNGIVGTAIASGKGAGLTKSWVLGALMRDVKNGYFNCYQAEFIKDDYIRAVNRVKRMF